MSSSSVRDGARRRSQTVKVVNETPPPPVEVALEEMVRRHLDDVRVRGLRPQSVYNRTRALARLTAWMGGPVLYATADDLRRWQKQRTAELTSASRATELSNVREFFRWAVAEGYLSTDPSARLTMPRVPRRVPRPVPDEALAYAMRCARPDVAAILGLAAFAGLRACEIARLDWSEVDLRGDPPMLRVVDGKGGHGRLVPIATSLAELLEALPDRSGAVVRRGDGSVEACQPHGVSARANTFLHNVGVTETLHQARHRFGTATYRACRDLRAVQELLGHASPLTTAGYAAASEEVGHQAVEAAGLLRP